MVTVDAMRCEGCRSCANVCPSDVFAMTGGKADPHGGPECVFCESCIGVCAPGAITIMEI